MASPPDATAASIPVGGAYPESRDELPKRGCCDLFSPLHLAAVSKSRQISIAAVYTDAAHIADGVIGLQQRSLAASDPTE